MSNNNSNTPNSLKNYQNLDKNNAKKAFPCLLLPKKNWHIIRHKSHNILNDEKISNINIQNIKKKPIKFKSSNNKNNFDEKQFFQTSKNGFNKFNLKLKKNSSSKIILDTDNNNTNYLITNNSYERTDMELMLLKKNEDIKKELENKENTFIYNQKIMQKKLEEKENQINKLKNELKKEKNIKKNEYENILTESNSNFINTIKKYKKKLESLKSKSKELTEKNYENEKTIQNLENKNKEIESKLNDENKKYNLLLEEKTKTLLEDDIKEYIKDLNQQISEQQNDIYNMREEITYLNLENKRLKNLTKEIIEARNETEIFFLDALNEAKMDLYKLKKEKYKRGSFFPILKNYYKINNQKVDIRDLTPEMREKILRNLFEKINRNYNEKNFRELNDIIEADISDDDNI